MLSAKIQSESQTLDPGSRNQNTLDQKSSLEHDLRMKDIKVRGLSHRTPRVNNLGGVQHLSIGGTFMVMLYIFRMGDTKAVHTLVRIGRTSRTNELPCLSRMVKKKKKKTPIQKKRIHGCHESTVFIIQLTDQTEVEKDFIDTRLRAIQMYSGLEKPRSLDLACLYSCLLVAY